MLPVMKEIIFSLSDVELGDGTVMDDFVADKLLAETIRNMMRKHKKTPLFLVVNGDGFDFLKASYKGLHPRYVTKEISLWKLHRIYNAHKEVFKVYKEFASQKKNTLVFVLGNHDMDLTFLEVQKELKKMIHSSVVFAGFSFEHGPVYIEHGAQYDSVFYVNPDILFLDHHGKKILNLPWVTYALFEHYHQYKAQYPFLERLYPRKLLMERYPRLAKELTFGGIKYFLRSAVINQIKYYNDLTYRLSPRLIKNFFYRLLTGKYELLFEDDLIGLFKVHKKIRVLIAGHSHIARRVHVKGDRWYLNTGTWRDEYLIKNGTNMVERKKKYLAEVAINGLKVDHVVLHQFE